MAKTTSTPAYLQVITQHGLNVQTISKPIKQRISKFKETEQRRNALEAGVETLQELKKNEPDNFKEADQNELDAFSQDLELVNSELKSIDNDLCNRINTYAANADLNKKKGERLRAGREKTQLEQQNIEKGLNTDGTEKIVDPAPQDPILPNDPPIDPVPDPAPPSNPPTPLPYTPVQDDDPPAEPTKKSNAGGVLAVLGILAVIGLAIFGIKKSRE